MANKPINFCRRCGGEIRDGKYYCTNCEFIVERDLLDSKIQEEQKNYREQVLKRDQELKKNDYP